MSLNFKELSKITDSHYNRGESKRVVADSLEVNDTQNPLDLLDVRSKDCAKTVGRERRYVVLDNATARNFKKKDRAFRRRFLSRLSDSERRKFLQMVKDAEEEDVKEQGNEQLDTQVFGVLLNNAVNSQSDKDLDLLNDFISTHDVSEPCRRLAEKVYEGDVDFDTDEDLIVSVCDMVDDEDETLLASFRSVYEIDTNGESELNVDFDTDTIEDSVDEDDDVLDDEDYLAELDENESEQEIEDSLTEKVLDSHIIEILTKGSIKKGESLAVAFEHVYDSVCKTYKDIDTKELSKAILNVCDNFADTISESLTEAIDNEVGEVSLVDLLNEALTAFAEGDSAPLEKFVNASTISEVGDLLEGNDEPSIDEIAIEGEEQEPIVENDEGNDNEQEYTEDEGDEDVNITEFNPTKREDCVKVAKLVLTNKMTRQISDALSGQVKALKDNIFYSDDETVGREVEPSLDTMVVPMTNSEYTSLGVETSVPSMVKQESEFNAPLLTEEPTTEGGVIILNGSTRPLTVVPFDMTVDNVFDAIKDMDLTDKRKFFTEHTVLVSDCVKFASKHNLMPFVDNRFYKRRISDAYWTINGNPKCLGDNVGTQLYPHWCNVEGDFKEVTIYGQKYKLK